MKLIFTGIVNNNDYGAFDLICDKNMIEGSIIKNISLNGNLIDITSNSTIRVHRLKDSVKTPYDNKVNRFVAYLARDFNDDKAFANISPPNKLDENIYEYLRPKELSGLMFFNVNKLKTKEMFVMRVLIVIESMFEE